MLQEIRQARLDVVASIGPDISYFTPSDERRFEPITLTLACIFLTAFLGGLGKKLGEATAEKITELITEKLDGYIKRPDEPDDSDLSRSAEDAAAAARDKPADVLSAAADDVESAVESKLLNLYLSRTSAKRISAQVRSSAMSLVNAARQRR